MSTEAKIERVFEPSHIRRGRVLVGDALTMLRTLPGASVQACVTSPPYWGLRDYGVEGQIGNEGTPDEYVARLVEVFREVRRVLRDDGTCWVNLGDSYCNTDKWGGGGTNTGKQTVAENGDVPSWAVRKRKAPIVGVKPKDLVGLPWAVAFALRSDGWYLRSDIIWHKPNPMPESVTDRPTKAHEYLFLLSRSERYFYDGEAIAERGTGRAPGNKSTHKAVAAFAAGDEHFRTKSGFDKIGASETRNARTVWTIPSQPYAEAHFATFPEELPERCIRAGTSERGCCPACGTPWSRQVKRERVPDRPGRAQGRDGDTLDEAHGRDGRTSSRYNVTTRTTGWVPICGCGGEPVPCVVLDPFCGSGTTGAVADANQRSFVGIELNPEYAKLAEGRIYKDGAPLFSAAGAKGATR